MRAFAFLLVSLCLAPDARAQRIIGAKAGLVSYALGDVTLDGQPVTVSEMRFPEMKERSVLRTRRGLAEVLLGPCSALRLGHDSAVRLVAADVTHPGLELLGGAAVVEISGIAKDADIALRLHSESILMARVGLYRVESGPALLRVFDGRATVWDDSRTLDVGPGRLFTFATGALGRFDRRPADELDRWSGRRSDELAELRAPAKANGTTHVPGSEHTAEMPTYNPRTAGRGRGDAEIVGIMPPGPGGLKSCVAGR